LPQAKKRGSEAAARETLLMNNQQTVGRKTIALNKRARFEYHIEERIEAGIALEGWEVKALREGRVQFADSYVLLKDNEAYLFGCLVNPLPTVSTHVTPDPTRTRKLLLHRREIDRLVGAVDRRGYTVVPTAMYWSRGKVKVEIGMATGLNRRAEASPLTPVKAPVRIGLYTTFCQHDGSNEQACGTARPRRRGGQEPVDPGGPEASPVGRQPLRTHPRRQ
jgi:SsrA-binding protein